MQLSGVLWVRPELVAEVALKQAKTEEWVTIDQDRGHIALRSAEIVGLIAITD